jgi:hypothetical protein
VSGLPTRLGLAAGAGLVALIVLVPTLWFAGDALLLLLEAKGFAPPAAAGLTALAGLVLAGLIGVWARWLLRPHRRPALPAATAAAGANGSAMNGIAADLGALVAQQLATSTRAHPYTTMGAALAAGLAVGAVPELRKTLTGIFKG